MMRSARSSCFVALAGIVVGIALAPARPAAACWGCWGSGHFTISPAVDETIPKDGAITFTLGTSGCGDAIWEGLSLEVWTEDDGQPVAGTVTYHGDLGVVTFRAAAPWAPGRSIGARVVVSEAVSGGDLLTCGEPGREAGIDVDIADAPASLPAPLPPEIKLEDKPILWSFEDVVCCPGSAPSSDTCSSVSLGPSGCAPMYRQTVQNFVASSGTAPRGQIAARLLVDDEVVETSIHGAKLSALRVGPACAVLEVEHLGTGEVLRSPEVCTPPEVAAKLGIHANDLASALECEALENCDAGLGNYGYEWDPDDCVAVNPLALPPPSRGFGDWPLASTCGHGIVELPGQDTAPPGDAAARGCGIASSGPEALLLVVFAGLRRRRRALPRACAGAGLP